MQLRRLYNSFQNWNDWTGGLTSMWRIYKDLVIISILSLLFIPLMVLTTGVLRITFGIAFVLLFPGYTLVAALFPKKDALDLRERVVLSFAMSLAIVPLIGLFLNYTPWGIRLYPITFSLLFFILLMAFIAWYRRRGSF